MKNQVLKILYNCIPIVIMILLIPFVKNDYVLTMLYLMIIGISLIIKYERREWLFLVFGFLIMIVAEYFFVSTGVETFERNTLFGLMPFWLPFLWAYGFVAMKRSIMILRTIRIRKRRKK